MRFFWKCRGQHPRMATRCKSLSCVSCLGVLARPSCLRLLIFGEDEMVLKFVRTALDRAGLDAIPR